MIKRSIIFLKHSVSRWSCRSDFAFFKIAFLTFCNADFCIIVSTFRLFRQPFNAPQGDVCTCDVGIFPAQVLRSYKRRSAPL